MFEEVFYQAIPKENELNAVFMIRYVIDMLRSQKVQHRQGVLRLISELRKIIENLYEIIIHKPDVFSRPQFINDNIDDEDYRAQFLEYLHFDIPIKPKRIHVYPRATNSIKVLTEFTPMTHLMILLFKDEVTDEISHLLRAFTLHLNYQLPRTNVDPEYSAMFQETQLKILNFVCLIVKPNQNVCLRCLSNNFITVENF
uniref:Uncharacterized protein n=1 Tax=Panagrolaimus superbus TaxID=310955 RepID=A0A914YLM8_9BILA